MNKLIILAGLFCLGYNIASDAITVTNVVNSLFMILIGGLAELIDILRAELSSTKATGVYILELIDKEFGEGSADRIKQRAIKEVKDRIEAEYNRIKESK